MKREQFADQSSKMAPADRKQGGVESAAKPRRERSRSRDQQPTREKDRADFRKQKKQTFRFEWDASEDTSHQKGAALIQPKIGFGKS